MRPVLLGLLVFVVCLPITFVLLIVAAAKYPKMDAFTLNLPMPVRLDAKASVDPDKDDDVKDNLLSDRQYLASSTT